MIGVQEEITARAVMEDEQNFATKPAHRRLKAGKQRAIILRSSIFLIQREDTGAVPVDFCFSWNIGSQVDIQAND